MTSEELNAQFYQKLNTALQEFNRFASFVGE